MSNLAFAEVLRQIRARRQHCLVLKDPVRLIYHGNPLGEGVGVTFVDPLIPKDNDDDPLSKDRDVFIKTDPPVLSISPDSDDPIGVKLAAIDPFFGYKEVKRQLVDAQGNQLDPIVLCWVKAEVESYTDEEETDDGYGNYTTWLETHWYNKIIDFAYNDFTNRSFNYLYVKIIATNKELTDAIQKYAYFTDGCRVSRQNGYSSCAYAVALYRSLVENHDLEAALRSYDSFIRFHPYDSITAMCEQCAMERFAGAELTNLEDPIRQVRNENVDPHRDDDRDNDLESVYYVDDTPVYGCGSQEEAEIEYWNTH